jgi:hypothetical protein
VVAPDWYPDPGGSSAERYWDGNAWTTHLRTAGEHSPTQSRVVAPRPGRGLIVGLSAALAAVVVLLIVGLVALLDSTDQPGSPNTSAPEKSVLSGSNDEWMASVCERGKYMDGGVSLPDSLSAGICLSSADGSPVSIGSFDTEFAAENAAAMYTKQGGSYATGVDSAGTVWLFISSWQEKGDTLTPLRDFGFAVQR